MDMEPLDKDYVQQVLSKLPFVHIPGVGNVRDLGSYPTSDPKLMTRPSYLFRAGEVSSITPEGTYTTPYFSLSTLFNLQGKSVLKSLGITTIFDLRSDTEIRKYNSPPPTIDGVDIVHIPVFKSEDYSPEMMAKLRDATSTSFY
jgi:hypothetical protein